MGPDPGCQDLERRIVSHTAGSPRKKPKKNLMSTLKILQTYKLEA